MAGVDSESVGDDVEEPATADSPAELATLMAEGATADSSDEEAAATLTAEDGTTLAFLTAAEEDEEVVAV